ncbi:pilus assembly protein [Streptomyces solicathayae]|uniref:Pilus assembly protein n=1 Tax=Streptomyces solicathayae TaxID=3081768 RepID=A0ABZ0LS95_9ACTN|nr:pilus assembly protein [Streptomyces sp. HUAS YS2]WOX22362.1 pilus assembly protein [Streptomyces sp. HUAS YS2]
MKLRAVRRDRGQAALELVGWIPILLIVALLVIQLGLGVFAAQQAGTGARAAARAVTDQRSDTSAETAGREAISDFLESGGGVMILPMGWGDEATVTVRVKVPSVVPGIDFGTAEKRATMPKD